MRSMLEILRALLQRICCYQHFFRPANKGNTKPGLPRPFPLDVRHALERPIDNVGEELFQIRSEEIQIGGNKIGSRHVAHAKEIQRLLNHLDLLKTRTHFQHPVGQCHAGNEVAVGKVKDVRSSARNLPDQGIAPATSTGFRPLESSIVNSITD